MPRFNNAFGLRMSFYTRKEVLHIGPCDNNAKVDKRRSQVEREVSLSNTKLGYPILVS